MSGAFSGARRMGRSMASTAGIASATVIASMAIALSVGAAAACGGTSAEIGSGDPAGNAPPGAKKPERPSYGRAAANTTAPSAACDAPPCAARPIIFVHGFRGSNDDFFPMMNALVRDDARFETFVSAGTDDADAILKRPPPRKGWLFAFDYYNRLGTDARGAYTAGPGRIGTNDSSSCPGAATPGAIVASSEAYDDDYTHEYAGDLAHFIDAVLAATKATKVDIVAHSMGGLVARSYLSFYGGKQKVERVLLLASPVQGVAAIAFLEYVGVGGPSWMKSHEISELDSGSVISRTRFSLCAKQDDDPGAWGQKLLSHEQATALGTPMHVMSGSKDMGISYESSDHPLARDHEIAQGADHAGILQHPDAIAQARTLLGGTLAAP